MSELIEACHLNRFPSLSILCDYGLDGRNGINPIELFELYKNAILVDKVSETILENAMKNDNLEEIVGIRVVSGYNK